VLSELRNTVLAQPVAETQWQAADEGQQLEVGGGVQTKTESGARVDISDGTIMRLAENTVFQLKELSLLPTDPVTRMYLEAGKVWVLVSKALGMGSFEVATPVGVATVRGSLISIEYAPDAEQMTVTCLEGDCLLVGTGGASEELGAGQQAEIMGEGQSPTAAHTISVEQLQGWSDNFPEAALAINEITPAPTQTPSATATATSTPTVTPSPTIRLMSPTSVLPTYATVPPTRAVLPAVTPEPPIIVASPTGLAPLNVDPQNTPPPTVRLFRSSNMFYWWKGSNWVQTFKAGVGEVRFYEDKGDWEAGGRVVSTNGNQVLVSFGGEGCVEDFSGRGTHGAKGSICGTIVIDISDEMIWLWPAYYNPDYPDEKTYSFVHSANLGFIAPGDWILLNGPPSTFIEKDGPIDGVYIMQ
jgi:hypothetical protein